MNVILEIADWKDFDPINGLHTPKGFMQTPFWVDDFYFQQNYIVKPFLQSYEYLVIGVNRVIGVVKIIPHCNSAKRVFETQYKNRKP